MKINPTMSAALTCGVVLASLGFATAVIDTSAFADDTSSTSAPSGSLTPEQVHAAIKSANPDYADDATLRFKNGTLFSFALMKSQTVSDLTPLAELPLDDLRVVVLYNSRKVTDLSAFANCPQLMQLNTERCVGLTSLDPLKDLQLSWFRMYENPEITDLTPLEGMPLKHLDLGKCKGITDLSPLAGMPLQDLRIDSNPQITDISVINQMPDLEFLSVFACSGVEDFSPLRKLTKLHTLLVTPDLLAPEDLEAIRQMDGLK